MQLTVQEIIDRLKEIQLERLRLIQEEQTLLNWLEEKEADNRGGPGHRSVGRPLSIEQSLTEDDISLGSDTSYGTGDRVYVKNKLGALAPTGRRANLIARAATVVATEDNRIYIKNYWTRLSWAMMMRRHRTVSWTRIHRSVLNPIQK